MRAGSLAPLLCVALALGACAADGDAAPPTTTDPAPEPATGPTHPTPPVPPASVTTAPVPVPVPVLPSSTTSAPSVTVVATSQPRPSEPLTEQISLEVGRLEREYTLHIPAGLAGLPVPLVIDFHGLTSKPEGQERLSAMRRKGDEEGFVVAQPAAILVANAWDTLEGSDDITFATAIIEDVAQRVEIDPQRVFATGFSAGGGMAGRLACDAADTFAAVAIVSGAHIGWKRCEPSRPVPFIAFYGDADIVVPIEGFGLLPDIVEWSAARAASNGCSDLPSTSAPAVDVSVSAWVGCDEEAHVVLYTIVGGGHGWPGTPDPSRVGDTTAMISATDLIWEFFMDHPKP